MWKWKWKWLDEYRQKRDIRKEEQRVAQEKIDSIGRSIQKKWQTGFDYKLLERVDNYEYNYSNTVCLTASNPPRCPNVWLYHLYVGGDFVNVSQDISREMFQFCSQQYKANREKRILEGVESL